MRIGAVVAGRYRIVRQAGAGGMGHVHRAVDEATGDAVAIKLLSRLEPADRLRFRREAEALAALTHPGIVRHVAHGEDGDQPYLVMEWVDGETLGERLAERGLTAAESLRALTAAARALAEAHRHGVVHRDIKPANLIFADEAAASIKLIDFGIARRADDLGALTATGLLMGTPAYMAPEQIRGDKGVDARADVFALGCVLHECLTGRQPFAGAHFLAVRAKVLFCYPPPASVTASEVPPALDELLARMLAKEPGQRPADAGEVAELLAALPEPEATTRRPAGDGAEQTERVAASSDARVTCAVAASPFSDEDGGGAPTLSASAREQLGVSVRQVGGKLETFPDGSVMAVFGPSREVRATVLTAADWAIAARPRFDDGVVALVSVRGDAVADALARVARLLAKEARTSVFAGVTVSPPPDGSVRVDDTTAELLGGQRGTVTRNGAAYLVP